MEFPIGYNENCIKVTRPTAGAPYTPSRFKDAYHTLTCTAIGEMVAIFPRSSHISIILEVKSKGTTLSLPVLWVFNHILRKSYSNTSISQSEDIAYCESLCYDIVVGFCFPVSA